MFRLILSHPGRAILSHTGVCVDLLKICMRSEMGTHNSYVWIYLGKLI